MNDNGEVVGEENLRNNAACSGQANALDGSAVIVGAKAAAGVGIGVLAVLGAASVVGLIFLEAILIPTVLATVAGGLAGGGIGLAKGISSEREKRQG